jgi:aldehyde dehydrogenase (NAD+)
MENSMGQFQDIFDCQKQYFLTNTTKSYEWRVEQLDRLHRLLSENHHKFLEAVGRDFKSSLYEQYFEVESVLGIIEATKSQLKGWMQPVEAPLPKFLRQSGHRGIIQREPYGVALVMGPFNGPLILSLHPLVTVLSAGNTAILKMPEAIPATTGLLLELIPQYFDQECVAGVRGGRDEVNELLKLPFDFIFFTGSTPTGKVIARAAAENLTPVLLELGGQNPAVVDETANLKDAAKKIIWGATAWGGQWCTSPGYATTS